MFYFQRNDSFLAVACTETLPTAPDRAQHSVGYTWTMSSTPECETRATADLLAAQLWLQWHCQAGVAGGGTSPTLRRECHPCQAEQGKWGSHGVSPALAEITTLEPPDTYQCLCIEIMCYSCSSTTKNKQSLLYSLIIDISDCT